MRTDSSRPRRAYGDVSTGSGEGDLVTAVLPLHPGAIDAVLDVATDPARLKHISQVLRGGGRLISTIESAEAPKLAGRGIGATNLAWQPSAELLDRIARLVDAGQLKVVIDHTYPLDWPSRP